MARESASGICLLDVSLERCYGHEVPGKTQDMLKLPHLLANLEMPRNARQNVQGEESLDFSA